jgi:hypothetical protein
MEGPYQFHVETHKNYSPFYKNYNEFQTIKCPYCLKAKQEPNNNELSKINCNKCYKSFIFIKCISCSGNIYFRYISKEYKFLLNLQISCPYMNCKVSFINHTCTYCTKINKRLNSPEELDTYLECTNINCKKKYSIIDNPEYGDDFIILNEKVPEGRLIKYGKEDKTFNYTFSQISCIGCFNHLIWKNDNMCKKVYVEGQPVICANSKCDLSAPNDRKYFNKVVCPYCCKKLIFKKNNFNFGVLIECIYCLGQFSQCFCPNCKEILYSEENLETVKINCYKCQISFCIVNCLMCRKINIWNGNSYVPGQTIICAYCQFKFNKVSCNLCRKIIPFYDADFKFGEEYKCIYEECQVSYSILLCPCCKVSNYVIKNENVLKQPHIKCGNCGISFFNISCLDCYKVILCLGEMLENFKVCIIKCPYNDCNSRRLFQFKKCCECKKLCYFCKENTKILNEFKNFNYDETCDICRLNKEKKKYKILSILFRVKSAFIKFANKEDLNYENNFDDYSTYSDLNSHQNYENFLLQSKNYFGINFKQGLKYQFDDPDLSKADVLREDLMIKNQKIYEISQNNEKYVNDLPTYDQLMECYSTLNS